MPHWGKAWALGPNYNLDIDDARAKAAYEAIAKAQSLAAQRPRERAARYIDALAVRYSADPKADRAALARAYSKAMGELSRRYPDDLDAAALYAESLMNLTPWKLWTLDGKPAAEHRADRRACSKSVLLRNPNHLGANHYYIHAVEASRKPARALPSAQRLDDARPSRPAIWSTCRRTFTRAPATTPAAARANAAGAAADRRYLVDGAAERHLRNDVLLAQPALPRRLAHDAGRFADAQQAAAASAEQLAPHVAMMPMVESMVVMPVSVLLRFGEHAEVLALPAPPADAQCSAPGITSRAALRSRRPERPTKRRPSEKLLATAIAAVPGDARVRRRRVGDGGERASTSPRSSLDARIALRARRARSGDQVLAAGGRGGRSTSLRRAAGVVLSGARVARRGAAGSRPRRRCRAGVPRRPRKAPAQRAVALRSAGGARQAGQGRRTPPGCSASSTRRGRTPTPS